MKVFADLHIHIGRSKDGKPVKITAARDLTIENVLCEASLRKGIQLVGVVDTGSVGVQKDLYALLEQGKLRQLPGGGLTYLERVTLIPGVEVETSEQKGAAHFVVYLPTMEAVTAFSTVLSRYITNMQLSTQKARLSVSRLWDMAAQHTGIVIPAHIFTPFKSVYGSCSDSLTELLRRDQFEKLLAVELGLSSDTELAQMIGELAGAAFLTNSDAHSLAKIGREYNLLQVQEADFVNFLWTLQGVKGNRIIANYGLDPKLGKYHRTFCEECQNVAGTPPPVKVCPICGSTKVVKGVLDRITEIADPVRVPRPPYIHQVPLQFLPGLGPKTLDKLLNEFGTEMNVLHTASFEELANVVGQNLAGYILASRSGSLKLDPGGGGIYGRVSGN